MPPDARCPQSMHAFAASFVHAAAAEVAGAALRAVGEIAVARRIASAIIVPQVLVLITDASQHAAAPLAACDRQQLVVRQLVVGFRGQVSLADVQPECPGLGYQFGLVAYLAQELAELLIVGYHFHQFLHIVRHTPLLKSIQIISAATSEPTGEPARRRLHSCTF